MINNMKTILSAVKQYVEGGLKKSVPNWNENNPDSINYIKNRPFYAETVYTTLMPKTTVTITDDDGCETISENYPQLVAGQTYYVMLNGVEYECIAREYSDDCTLIGNGEIYGDGDASNNEPFSCDSYDDGTIYLNTALAGDYTIEIFTKERIIRKIDEKFIPDLDWNSIKNRPFGEGCGDLILEYHSETPQNQVWDIDVNINQGETYIAIYNGVEYIMVANSYNGVILGSDADTSFPFYIADTGDGYGIMTFNNDLLDLVIYKYGIKQLDEKYLPDSIGESFDELHTILNESLADAQTCLNEEISNRETADNLKMDKENPAGTGSFSVNRKADTTIGDYSSAIGQGSVANNANLFVTGTYNEYSDDGFIIKESRTTTSAYSSNGTAAYGYASTYTFNESTGEFIYDAEGSTDWDGIPVGYYFSTGVKVDGKVRTKVLYYRDTDTRLENVTGKFWHYVNALKLSSVASNVVNGDYIQVVGNGTSDTARSNAHTLDWDGNAWFQGAVYVGGTGQDDENAKKLATEESVTAISTLVGDKSVATQISEAMANAGGGVDADTELITIADIDEICGATV